MKTNCQNQKCEIDWIIRAFCDEEKRDDPEYITEYRTDGFNKYGKGEIVVVGKNKNAQKIVSLINTFGKMLAEGEIFDADGIHCIWNNDGEKEFTFSVIYGEYENGELWIQLIPDFEQNACELQCLDEGDEVETIIYANNRPYVILIIDGESKLCRLDKIVWQTWADNNVDIFDDSWELGYKDGDYKNCAIDNLYLIKKD